MTLVLIETQQPWDGWSPIGDVTYQANIEQVWSSQELLAIGLVAPLPFTSEAGKIPSGPAVYVKNPDGSVSTTYTLVTDPGPSLDDTKTECARRIFADCPATSQSNMNGYINLLNATVTQGGTLTDAQKADLTLFSRAMAWINAMRSQCGTLVGNLAYQQDASWPALDADILAFAERF